MTAVTAQSLICYVNLLHVLFSNDELRTIQYYSHRRGALSDDAL